MIKKINIFDAILFGGNINFIKLRVLEFYENVDYFILIPISESDKHTIDNEIEFFNQYQEKIIVTELYQDDSQLQNLIKEIVKEKYVSFDDLIFLSRENEIPNFKELDSIYEEIIFNSILLSHTKFSWNIDYIFNISEDGAYVFNFSSFLTGKDLILKIKDKKDSNSERIKNGWKFENFHEPKENEIFFRENLLPLSEYDPATTYQLIKRDFEIPESFNILGYNKIGRDYMKKHLFLVESNKSINLIDIKKLYDTVSIVTFSDNVNEIIAENIGDEVYKSVLYVPDRILYDETGLKEFQDKYKKNEIKKIIQTMSPLDQDLIRIIYKDFNDFESTWEQIKNENMSEIINPS